MSFTSEQNAMLAAPLDPKHIVKPTGNFGPKGDYIEGWHAIAEANRIFGFGAWERELIEWKETNRDLVDVTKNNRTEKQWRVGYVAKVRVTVHGEGGSRSREGIGFGSGFAKDNALGEALAARHVQRLHAPNDAGGKFYRLLAALFGVGKNGHHQRQRQHALVQLLFFVRSARCHGGLLLVVCGLHDALGFGLALRHLQRLHAAGEEASRQHSALAVSFGLGRDRQHQRHRERVLLCLRSC